MKLNEKEKAVLLGVFEDREHLASLPSDPAGVAYGPQLGAYRLRIKYAQEGLVPMNLAGWIGHTPTESECVMYHRAYKRLEAVGLLDRINLCRGRRTSHLRLTPAGEATARSLQALKTPSKEATPCQTRQQTTR
jgi:hypothetical protein